VILDAAPEAAASACGGFGAADAVASERLVLHVGKVAGIAAFGHRPDTGQTIVRIKNARNERQFRLGVASAGAATAMATVLASSRKKGARVEACGSATTLPKSSRLWRATR